MYTLAFTQRTCSDFNCVTISALSRENATRLLKIIVTYPRDMREKWKAHFARARVLTHMRYDFLHRWPCEEYGETPLAVASIARMRARMGIIYLPCAPQEKWVKENDVHVVYVCARTRAMPRFLLYVQHVPRGIETNVFKPALFVPVHVRAWAMRVSWD